MQALPRLTPAAAETGDKATKSKIATPDIDTEKLVKDLRTKVCMPVNQRGLLRGLGRRGSQRGVESTEKNTKRST